MPDSINILVPKESIDSIIQADQVITKLDVTYRKMLTTIEQGSKILKDEAVNEDNLNKAKNKTKENTEQLDALGKKLLATETKLKEMSDERYKDLVIEQQAISRKTKEILAEVSGYQVLTGTIEKAEASTKALTAERKKLDLETIEGTKRLKEINAAIDKNTEVIRSNGDAATKQRMNIGNYKSALEGLPGPLGNIATSANTAGTALKAVSKIPLLAVILAIIGALAGLFSAFKSTEEGGDRVQKIFGKLKGILDVLKIAAQSVALAFADLLSGKFGQAAEHLKEGFGGIGGRLKEAAIAGGNLAEALDQIGDEKLAYNIDAVREKIAQLRTEAAETTDPGERAAKLREAIKLTEELYGKQIDWSKRAANAEIDNVTAKFNVSKDQLRVFLLADEAGRQEQIKGNQSLGTLANSLNNEGLASLRDKLTEESKLNTEFNKETLRIRKTAKAGEESDAKEATAAYKKRVEDQRKAFEEDAKLKAEAIAQMAEEDKNTLIDKNKQALAEISLARDTELAAVNQAYVDGTISFEKAEAKKLEIARKYELLILQENLRALEATTAGMTPGQQAEAAAKIAAMKLQITENLAKNEFDAKKYWDDLEMAELEANEKAIDELRKEREKKDKEAEQRKQELIDATFQLTSELGNAIFEVNNQQIETEIDNIERKRDTEIKAAGENKDAQKAINAKYDKEVADQKTKQAKNDRDAAIFNIAINTAEAIIKAMTVDPTGVLAIIAASIGAIQAGVVLSKPLPTFAKGTKGQFNTPSAFVAGEAGTEWMQKRTGELFEVTKPTVFTNAAGMRIYPNSEIKQLHGMMVNNQIGFDTSELKEIHKGIDNMARALSKQKQYNVQNGKVTGYTQSGYKRNYLERMLS